MTTAKDSHLNTSVKQVIQFNERLVNAGKRAGGAHLDSYERLVESVTKLQQKLADQSKNEAVRKAVATQVDLTRRLTSAYTSAARDFIS